MLSKTLNESKAKSELTLLNVTNCNILPDLRNLDNSIWLDMVTIRMSDKQNKSRIKTEAVNS